MARCRTPADGEDDRMIHERASLRQRHIMQDMTTRIVPIEPQWFMQKAEVQSRTWRELNQGHIPQDIVDAITPAFALKLTRGHAADPNQVVLIALADDRVVGFIELLRTPRPPDQSARGRGTGVIVRVGIRASPRSRPRSGRSRTAGSRQRPARLVGRRFQHQRSGILPTHRIPRDRTDPDRGYGAGTRNDQLLAGRWSSCRSSCCARR